MWSAMTFSFVGDARSAEAAGDVVLGLLLVGVHEDPGRSAPNSISSPRYMKAVYCEMRAACCMLWVTMTMVNSVRSCSISSSILPVEIGSSAEVGSSKRIDLRALGDGAGDAEALLLAAGEAHAGLAQLVLDLVPQRRLAQGALDALVELGARELLVEAQAEGDVVVDRHREGRRLLEHHADARAQLVHVDRRSTGCCARRG